MKARLNTLMGQAQQELNSFGDSAIFGDKNQVWDCNPHTLSSAYRRTARGLDIASHDSICSRLRGLDRRYKSWRFNEITFWWCPNILHFQRHFWSCTRLYRCHSQFGKSRYSHCDPQFDGSSTNPLCARNGIRSTRKTSNQTPGGSKSSMCRVGLWGTCEDMP